MHALVFVLITAAAADAGPLEAVPPAQVAPAAQPSALGVTDWRADAPTSLEHDELGAGEELNLGWTLFRTALVLGIVVALAYLTLNVGLRRLMGIKSIPGASGVVSVLERIPLDQKRVLFVVKAANEVLLIGGSDLSLSLITKLDPAEVEKLKAPPSPPLQLSPFLQKLLGRKEAPPAPPPSDSRSTS